MPTPSPSPWEGAGSVTSSVLEGVVRFLHRRFQLGVELLGELLRAQLAEDQRVVLVAHDRDGAWDALDHREERLARLLQRVGEGVLDLLWVDTRHRIVLDRGHKAELL